MFLDLDPLYNEDGSETVFLKRKTNLELKCSQLDRLGFLIYCLTNKKK